MCSIISSRMCLVSIMETFEYMLEMSSDANVRVGSIGISFRF